MDISKALDQISQIHAHLTRAELFRHYRAFPVAVSGLLALGAAAAQPWIAGSSAERATVLYWIVVAFLGALVSGGGILRRYLGEEDARARRRTRIVVGQLLPAIVAGAAVTPLLLALDGGDSTNGTTALLPGLWAIFLGLGTFASRPYLPRAIGFVALFYLIAGCVLLATAHDGFSLSPRRMGFTFGIGQVLAGVVLYWNLERPHSHG